MNKAEKRDYALADTLDELSGIIPDYIHDEEGIEEFRDKVLDILLRWNNPHGEHRRRKGDVV